MKGRFGAAMTAAVLLAVCEPGEANPLGSVVVHAGLPEPTLSPLGLTCSLVSLTRTGGARESEEGQAGILVLGPMIETQAPTSVDRVTCYVMVGDRIAEGCKTEGVPPVIVGVQANCSYLAPEHQAVVVCTEVHRGPDVYYWNASTAQWTLDPSCTGVLVQQILPPLLRDGRQPALSTM
jgi:hypothetical protein